MGTGSEMTQVVPMRTSASPFRSILFTDAEQRSEPERLAAPDFFGDLNLDQMVDVVTDGQEEYELNAFFFAPLDSVAAITYRQEVFQDLEGTPLFGCLGSFAQRMRSVRKHLAQAHELRYPYQKQRWFLDSAAIYGDAVTCLVDDLARADVTSAGFLGLSEYLTAYVKSQSFVSLTADMKQLYHDLGDVTYCIHVKGARVSVSTYEGQPDYSEEVQATFEKFEHGPAKDYREESKGKVWPDMNHVEARILDLVAQLFPEPFASLTRFWETHQSFLDLTLARFDREVEFYLAYLDYLQPLRSAGLPFCYPEVSATSKEISATATFDLPLAHKLRHQGVPVVLNDFSLGGRERVIVVTGPNQGGKTTFARAFGQLHYLASLGCPVPGRDASLFLCDRLFTHFEREENVKTLSGKLQEDLIRVHRILEQATSNSIILLNEIFTSTTLHDALLLGERVLRQIIGLDLLCLCVTFVDEWASLGPTTVSMVGLVAPDNPAVRTYKIIRKPADGMAYAAALAEKYGLTFEQLRDRIAP